ncbi:MFS domain-containing protein [Mycena kentingensis (nom. inval.)]|nr:MFS domain-containing protein [Mycena kentingensis (nom. inval.)]
MSAAQTNDAETQEKRKPGESWKAGEVQSLPKNRLPVVFLALTLSVFLAAMDQTIVATALPIIVGKLGGGKEYSWVGSAYLLAAAALSPLYGKLSDIFGRKPLLYSCIVVFLIGSALCGAAQSMTMLVIFRAVQGVGGGGIMQLVNITISDIVSLEDRGKFIGLLASIVGPLLGGALAQHVSWRWIFWINLPTGGVAGLLLFFFLNLNPRPLKSFADHNAEFDYIGLVAVVVGVVCVLLGFNFSETSWSSPQTIALLVVGFVLLFAFGIWECYTTKSPIVPPRLFKTRTTSIILVTTLMHALAFFSGAYYLPLYFQVLGASATGAGVRMLPYSLGGAVVSALSGQLVARIKEYRPIIWFAWPVMTLGYGLMIMLDDHSSAAKQAIFPLVAALGTGCLFQTPLIGLQAAMPLKDMATSTSAYVFIRTLGGTIAIAMGQVVITSTLRRRIAHIPDLGRAIDTSAATLSQNVVSLKSIADATTRNLLIHAYARSISTIWIVIVPITGAGAIMVLFIRRYSLTRRVVRTGEEEKEKDLEKGSPQTEGATNGDEAGDELDEEISSKGKTKTESKA